MEVEKYVPRIGSGGLKGQHTFTLVINRAQVATKTYPAGTFAHADTVLRETPSGAARSWTLDRASLVVEVSILGLI